MTMKPQTVTLTLTLAEARGLSHAAGNSTDHPDAMEALFQTKADRQIASRGHQKLDDAIKAAMPGGQSLADEAMHSGLKAVVKAAVARAERETIMAVGAHTQWNVTQMARLLKVTWKTVHHKMKTYNCPYKN